MPSLIERLRRPFPDAPCVLPMADALLLVDEFAIEAPALIDTGADIVFANRELFSMLHSRGDMASSRRVVQNQERPRESYIPVTGTVHIMLPDGDSIRFDDCLIHACDVPDIDGCRLLLGQNGVLDRCLFTQTQNSLFELQKTHDYLL